MSASYQLTTDIRYGYRQLDRLALVVDGRRTFTLPLKPIDDLVVTDVVVDGQGSIPPGGVVNVPPQGVTLRVRGKCQMVKYPATDRYVLSAYVGGASRSTVSVLSPTEWELTRIGWVPCATVDGPERAFCIDGVSSIQLGLSRQFSLGNEDTLVSKDQRWPLTYRQVSQ